MTRPMQDPFDPSRWLVGDVDYGPHVGPGVLASVHQPAECAGRPCVLHGPSEHALRDWPLTWRTDRGIFERRCPHGVGHPDPDDAAYRAKIGQAYRDVHGCDGCCSGERCG